MLKFKSLLIYLIYFTLALQVVAQVKIKELNSYSLSDNDSLFVNVNKFNKIIPINKGWSIYLEKESSKVSPITVPAVFDGEKMLYFEKNFSLSKKEIENNNVKLVFNGIYHTAEIYVNNVMVFKTLGGELPFSVSLAKDLLKYTTKNKLVIQVIKTLDSENTIPVKHRFLFPKENGGISRDVYLMLTPIINISSVHKNYSFSNDLQKVKLSFTVSVDKKRFDDHNKNFKAFYSSPFTVDITISNKKDKSQLVNYRGSLSLSGSELTTTTFNFEASNPKLWSLNDPQNYVADVKLYYEDALLDINRSLISFYKLDFKDGQVFFNRNFTPLRGVTYYQNSLKNGNLISHEQIEKDLQIIKDLGFNTVRFARALPNPYSLYVCEKLGLMAFIEIPVNSIPEDLLDEPNFVSLSQENLKSLITDFSEYSSVAAIGVGSSFLPGSVENTDFISKLSEIIKKQSTKYSYASFVDFPFEKINNLDLYGVELYSSMLSERYDRYLKSEEQLGKSSLFISEATYPTFAGSVNGYLTPFTLEAQAYYFEDLLDFSKKNNINNLFLNTAFDYTGNTGGLYAGYDENNVYQIGIVGIDRNVNRISYKLVKSKLSESEKITIPIGKKLDDTPFFFIVASLVLSIIMALFINSRRKFREDASRALFRPYNFFADIRDQRILSGFHANILMIILAGTHSLLITNLLFALRGNILLEKIVISLGIGRLINFVSYLAWNPASGFIYLFLISILFFFVLAAIIKGAAFFVKIRVYFSSIYFVVIWAFLPLVLLLPVELVLYKVITLNVANVYVYLFLGLFAAWLIQRLLKGVFVIFDVVPFAVYTTGIVAALVVFFSILVLLQLSDSSIDFILNSISQFNLL